MGSGRDDHAAATTRPRTRCRPLRAREPPWPGQGPRARSRCSGNPSHHQPARESDKDDGAHPNEHASEQRERPKPASDPLLPPPPQPPAHTRRSNRTTLQAPGRRSEGPWSAGVLGGTFPRAQHGPGAGTTGDSVNRPGRVEFPGPLPWSTRNYWPPRAVGADTGPPGVAAHSTRRSPAADANLGRLAQLDVAWCRSHRSVDPALEASVTLLRPYTERTRSGRGRPLFATDGTQRGDRRV